MILLSYKLFYYKCLILKRKKERGSGPSPPFFHILLLNVDLEITVTNNSAGSDWLDAMMIGVSVDCNM